MDCPDIKIVDSVKVNGRHFDPEIRRILDVVRMTAPEMAGNIIWITSAWRHDDDEDSKHFTNEAFDIRIRNVRGLKYGVHGQFIYNDIIEGWVKRIRLELGQNYDVVYGDKDHLDHIHVEYDQKN